MELFDKKSIDILSNLKENFGAFALKAEFEAEGASVYDALLLKKPKALVTGVRTKIIF